MTSFPLIVPLSSKRWYLELAARRPLAASVTIMHAHAHHIILRQEPLVSLPRRISHVQLSIAHIDDLTSAPHASSPKRLPTCSSNPSPPHASLASACIPRLRMHRPAQRAACIALSGELHALSGEPVLSLSRKETREPCGEEPSCRGDHAMVSRRGERGGGDGALSAGEREGGWGGTEHCEYWGSAPALSAADAESGERSPQGVI